MKLSKKNYIYIIILLIFSLLIFLTFDFFNQIEVVDNKNNVEEEIVKIKDAVSDFNNLEENFDLSNITVTNISTTHARAEFLNTEYSSLLVKSGNDWRVVHNSEDSIYCEEAEKFGFSASFINDCVLQYPDAISLDDYDESYENDSIRIVADLSESQDPFCDCLIFEDEDTETTFVYNGDDVFEDGDTLVVDVVDGEIVDVVDIIEEDEDDSDDDDDQYNVYINPDPETPSEYQEIFYYIDIDSSNKEIQLITDL